MTTTTEHDTHEQPTAANYTAGDSFAKIAAEIRRCAGNNNADFHLTWATRIEALAASHREPSGRGNSQPAVVHGEAVAWANFRHDPPSYVPFRTRKEAEQSVEKSEIAATQNGPYSVVPLYPPSQPADKPAGQAVTDAQILSSFKDNEHAIRLTSMIRDDVVIRDYRAALVGCVRAALAPEPATAVEGRS